MATGWDWQGQQAGRQLQGPLCDPACQGYNSGYSLDDVIQLWHGDLDFHSTGLFNPENDKDACGVGFVGELSKKPTRACVKDALEMLNRM